MSKHYRLSLWHPWTDKPGLFHNLGLFSTDVYNNVDTLIEQCGGNRLYLFCNDILDQREFSYSTDLLHQVGLNNVYASQTKQGIVAVRMRHGRTSGYLIPGSTWGYPIPISLSHLKEISELFSVFDLEALSPSSLSEKVLRSTLPEKLYLQRPNASLRAHLIDNHVGGRIDKAEKGQLHANVYEYDENKSYLDKAQIVPSPFAKPVYFFGNHTWDGAPTAFLHVHLTAHGSGIHPIQLFHGEMYRTPREGEQFWRWLWKEELTDCLEAGYTLNAVDRGYAWFEMSTFMQEWIDILWNAWEKHEHPLIKTMMVGLPGRFLKKPENWLLVPIQQSRPGDIPIVPSWDEQAPIEWCLHAEPHMQSAQLTPIGSYIPMMCRQNLYHILKKLWERDIRHLRTYIDNFSTEIPVDILPMGILPGQWKEKQYGPTWVEHNQQIPLTALSEAKMPGSKLDSVFRQRKIDQIISKVKIPP
jgi:DNA polymerase type B, organellar and viral